MPKKRDHGAGGLYKLKGRNLWRGVYDAGFDVDGKRLQAYVHARTQAECREKLKALIEDIEEHGAPINRQVTLAKWASTWLATVAKPHLDPKTYSTYASLTRRWIVPKLGRKRVATLSPADVRALRAHIIDENGKSPSTARQAQIVLSMMLDAAREERLTRSNVADTVRKPKQVKARRPAMTTDQALAILRAAAELPDGSRWWFKLLAGARQTEILGATLADLDLDGGTYTIQWKLEELIRDHGCGPTGGQPACGYKRGASCPSAVWRVPDGFERRQIEGRLHLTRPKSQAGKVVPLIPQLAEAIRRYLTAMADLPNLHGLIWRHDDGSPITVKEDNAQWRALLVKAGVITEAEAVPGGTPLTGHVARHTVVTILASLGVDLQVIGEIVGHADEEVTRIYRHVLAAEKRAAMEALGSAWAEGLALPGRAEQAAEREQGVEAPVVLGGAEDDGPPV